MLFRNYYKLLFLNDLILLIFMDLCHYEMFLLNILINNEYRIKIELLKNKLNINSNNEKVMDLVFLNKNY